MHANDSAVVIVVDNLCSVNVGDPVATANEGESTVVVY